MGEQISKPETCKMTVLGAQNQLEPTLSDDCKFVIMPEKNSIIFAVIYCFIVLLAIWVHILSYRQRHRLE